MQILSKKTASSWDSFRTTLIKVLAEFKPKTVFEYGPGTSTLIMQDFPSIEKIITIEHDVAWFHKWATQFGEKITLILEEDLNKYPYHLKSENDYDLYFIDGREREACLDLCNRFNSIVILHDAEREQYRPNIQQYNHIFMEDDGHTAVLCNNDKIATRLEKLFCV